MAANADLTRGPALLSVSMGTASFAFATTAIRFCVRKRISNNVGLDDYAMGVASVCRIPRCGPEPAGMGKRKRQRESEGER